MSLQTVKTISEIVEALGIGIGAFLGGLGVLKVIGEWYEKRRYKREKSKWLRLYPKEQLNEGFKILFHRYSLDPGSNVVGSSPHLYLCDDRTKTRHWIINPETLMVLGFNHDEATGVSESTLKKYKIGEQIDLTPNFSDSENASR